jgi:pSer/pThr/pTyr-binding forkhead associated (FHA) protein
MAYTIRLGEVTTVGRSSDADVFVESSELSRNHARIESYGNGTVVLRDLESRNGTFCNEERIERRELQGGESIRFGNSTLFEFRYLERPEKLSLSDASADTSNSD